MVRASLISGSPVELGLVWVSSGRDLWKPPFSDCSDGRQGGFLGLSIPVGEIYVV